MVKVNSNKDSKFQDSLKSWGENDNRPFIRIKEDRVKDEQDYKAKQERILREKRRIAAITGDPLDKIHLHDNWGSKFE